ncbi:unnamed protein product [Ostreobium quekettii]|uniref:Uncharacterized protein n=1 Tax=Ostreobium quekettii TaxID=121088 RepID=A0A8S1IVX7_9CHLO|nr:unnamed protein product [Ostreobium quekettii]|eukprot:evm.model.scf_175.5 EVM.evm.TU.scf_175.5   scf_175:115786-122998(-)
MAAAVCALAVALLPSGASASGAAWDLNAFDLCKQVGLPYVDDNASGATYNSDTGSLWVVTRSPNHLVELSQRGEFLRKVSWHGFDDPEGVAWVGGHYLAVVEEPTHGGITVVNVAPGVADVYQGRTAVGIEVWSNAGLEGIAYNHQKGVYYVVQEKGPKRVVEVHKSGYHKELFNLESVGVGDLSGIYYSSSIDNLFILSQESRSVIRLAMDGNSVQQRWDIGGDRPEGIAFTPDGQKMFIVSEPRSMSVYSTNGCDGIY